MEAGSTVEPFELAAPSNRMNVSKYHLLVRKIILGEVVLYI